MYVKEQFRSRTSTKITMDFVPFIKMNSLSHKFTVLRIFPSAVSLIAINLAQLSRLLQYWNKKQISKLFHICIRIQISYAFSWLSKWCTNSSRLLTICTNSSKSTCSLALCSSVLRQSSMARIFCSSLFNILYLVSRSASFSL